MARIQSAWQHSHAGVAISRAAADLAVTTFGGMQIDSVAIGLTAILPPGLGAYREAARDDDRRP